MKPFFLCCLLGSIACAQDPKVKETREHHDPGTGLTILQGTLNLPGDGYWAAVPSKGPVLADVFLVPSQSAEEAMMGLRKAGLDEQRAINRDNAALRRCFWAVHAHAREAGGWAPKTLVDVPKGHEKVPGEAGLAYHYIPPEEAVLEYRERRWHYAKPVKLLAFQLRPLIDDGKHWVLNTHGNTEYRDIDPALFEKHGVTLVKGKPPVEERFRKMGKDLPYQLYARRVAADAKTADLVLTNHLAGATLNVTWKLDAARDAGSAGLTEWASHRLWSMPLSPNATESAILPYWYDRAGPLYKIPNAEVPRPRRRGRRRGNQATMFGVLGGRAAIEETLQLQNLVAQAGKKGGPPVPIETIKGVTVQSHPFEEMLDGQPGGRLPLAELAPPDRFFAYFAQPKGMLQLLDGGASFLFNTGSSATGHSLEYRLVERYLKGMGLSDTWLRRFLESGAVAELALMAPDLFFIDGTEITVACRLKNPLLAAGVLKLAGVDKLKDRAVLKTESGASVYWAKRGEFLFISTAESELDQVLALHAAKGEGSLGHSAEFRYMLTQLPLNKHSNIFVYFSDPFIRHLVSPQTKIAQLRRLRVRTELEGVSAGALLYRMDGHPELPSIETLVSKQYVRPLQVAQDVALRPDLVAESPRYGRPGRMQSLIDQPVGFAEYHEHEAYKQYLANYNRYWRRFFDPIAIRIDEPAKGTFDLSVFILPLIDNSIYQGLRNVLPDGESEAEPVIIPELDPKPVGLFSFNVNEKAWSSRNDGIGEALEDMIGIEGAILDNLGPDIHLGLADGDPIIGMGSGEFMQLFGAGFDNDLIGIPALVAMLTRPSYILIGLKNPERVSQILDTVPAYAMSGDLFDGDFGTGSLYKVAGADQWIFSYQIAGMLNLRFGLEVKDRYLVFKNLPLTQPVNIVGRSQAPLNGAQLLLNPSACLKQLPSLHASAFEQQRHATMAGVSYLHPLMAAGAAPWVEKARDQHRELFGFAPVHPKGGDWSWDGHALTSSMFGSMWQQQQPAWKPGDRSFGVFQRIKSVRLGMQFEQDGLRTTVRWELNE